MRIDARHLFLAAATALVACGISAVGTLDTDGGSPPGTNDAAGPTVDGAAPELDADSDGGTTIDGGPDGTVGPPAIFYVTTETQLYSYAPLTKTWTFLANISGCPNADEIAVNDKGEIFGTSYAQRALYKFTPPTYACTKVADTPSGPWGWSLSFVPKQTFDAGEDQLIGYTYRDFIRIKLDGGSTLVTSNALDSQEQPSGDIVSMGSRAFVSVTGSATCTPNDCLYEINPATGEMIKNWGNFPTNEIWALAQWGGKIYGFKQSGVVYEVTLAEPLGFTTVPGPDGGTNFAGAGSSTMAPTQ